MTQEEKLKFLIDELKFMAYCITDGCIKNIEAEIDKDCADDIYERNIIWELEKISEFGKMITESTNMVITQRTEAGLA